MGCGSSRVEPVADDDVIDDKDDVIDDNDNDDESHSNASRSKKSGAKLSQADAAPTHPKPRPTADFALPSSMATLIPPKPAIKKLQSDLIRAQKNQLDHSDQLRESLRELVSAAIAAAPTSQVQPAPRSPLLDPAFLALAGEGLDGEPLGTKMGLALINELRGLYGFQPETFSSSWAEKAKQHCEYYLATGDTGHYEDKESEHYTEGGDEAAHISGLAYGGRQFVDALNSLLAGPFHRRSLIYPWPSSIGLCYLSDGLKDGRVCAMLPGKPVNEDTMWDDDAALSPRFKCFPPDGFNKAHGTFAGESPDPRPPDARSACGLIVSVVFSRPEDINDFRKLTVHRFHDSTADQPVAHWSKDPARGGTPVSEAEWMEIYNEPKPKGKNHLESQEEVWLGALTPLAAGHRFEVDLTFEFEGSTERLTWSFETLPPSSWTIDDPESNDFRTALLFSTPCDTLYFTRRGGVYNVPAGVSLEFARVQGLEGAQEAAARPCLHLADLWSLQTSLEIFGCHVSLDAPIQLLQHIGDQRPIELTFELCSFGRCEKIEMFFGSASFIRCDFTECSPVDQGRYLVFMGPETSGLRVKQCRFGPSSQIEVFGAVNGRLHRIDGLVTPSDESALNGHDAEG